VKTSLIFDSFFVLTSTTNTVESHIQNEYNEPEPSFFDGDVDIA